MKKPAIQVGDRVRIRSATARGTVRNFRIFGKGVFATVDWDVASATQTLVNVTRLVKEVGK